jgi:hypothetical protein
VLRLLPEHIHRVIGDAFATWLLDVCSGLGQMFPPLDSGQGTTLYLGPLGLREIAISKQRYKP